MDEPIINLRDFEDLGVKMISPSFSLFSVRPAKVHQLSRMSSEAPVRHFFGAAPTLTVSGVTIVATPNRAKGFV
jgi:hypothetical protein